MKRSVAAVFCAAALVPGGVAIKTSTAVAEAKAQAWLREHRGAPQQDELAELKSENPEAYGIVKALLTKRSLGLLDPRHPSASFAAPPPQDSPAPQGAEAFEKIAAESGERPKVAPMYAEAPVASTHHDWLNWKPQQSAMDDEAMVKSVLGAVAELKGGGGALRGSTAAAPAAPAAADDAGSVGGGLQWAAPAAPVAVAPIPAAAPAQPAAVEASQPQPAKSQENPYLTGIGLDAAAAPPQRAAASENSYLKGLDLDGAAPSLAAAAPAGPVGASKPAVGLSAVKRDEGTNYLSSFSWDDSAPAPPKVEKPPAPLQAAAPEVAAPVAPAAAPSKKQNALLAWLGGGKTAAPAPKQAPAKQQAPAQNSYLMDLA